MPPIPFWEVGNKAKASIPIKKDPQIISLLSVCVSADGSIRMGEDGGVVVYITVKSGHVLKNR